MRARILGPVELVVDGRPVRIGGARLRALFARLALDAGRVVPMETLAQALWADSGPSDRANALQSLVSRLRQILPDTMPLRSGTSGYCLDVPGDEVDALLFERLARAGRTRSHDGDAAGAAATLREALDLWRGDPLANITDAPFTAAVAVRLAEQRLTATEDRIDAELATVPKDPSLVAELEGLISRHPLRERLRLLLMKALYQSGRQAEALDAFERFRTLLADELGADPGQELRDTHLAVLRDEVPAAPPAPPGRRRGNLHDALTSLVGRDADQRDLAERLSRQRLVTLVGPGGAGKTRLATAVGSLLADRVPGGVWLVELAVVTDPADVPHAVLNALGLRGSGLIDAAVTPQGGIDRLVEALSANQAIVILDNCEHVVDAAARLCEELLGRCPQLRILATSREPLWIVGESLHPVRPLPLPEPGAPLAEAVRCPAVALFADRVAAVRPGFAVTPANLPAVTEICRRLDGLPLAIELAAARIRSLPIEELAARLDDRYRLLTGGSRTALSRHRTLRAVVAWSWELLDDTERQLAEWLSVFPGIVTPDSAARVAAPATAVLDSLAVLVDKSLLQVLDVTEPRYRMLETIREYGLERLAETGRIGAARADHAAYFAELAERAEPYLRGAGQVGWFRRLNAEHDNLLAALHFAVGTQDAATATRLAAALGPYWAMRGAHVEALGWLRLALDLPGAPSTPAWRRAAAGYLVNAVLSGGYVGRSRSDELLPIRADGVPAEDHPVTALLEPAAALLADDTDRGLAVIQRRLSHPDPWPRAALRLLSAFLRANHGDAEGRYQDLVAAVAGFRELGDRWGTATALTWLADAQTAAGELGGAIASLAESIALARELDPDDGAVLQRVWLAVARAQQGDTVWARAELRGILAHGGGTSSRYLAFARISLGDLCRYDGDLAEAARQYDAAADELDRVPFYATLFRALLECSKGHLALDSGDPAEAAECLARALDQAVRSAEMPLAAMVGVAVARLCLSRGAAETAAEVLGASHALRGASDASHPDVLRVRTELDERLGAHQYQAAYRHGRELDRDTALARITAWARAGAAAGP